jgi:hypothetical protein
MYRSSAASPYCFGLSQARETEAPISSSHVTRVRGVRIHSIRCNCKGVARNKSLWKDASAFSHATMNIIVGDTCYKHLRWLIGGLSRHALISLVI